MSAANFVRSASKITILTDEALYNRQGIVLQLGCKVVPMTRWVGATWGRGNGMALVSFHATADSFSSLDDFVANSADEIKEWFQEGIADGTICSHTEMDAFAAGWSHRQNQLMIFRIYADRVEHEGDIYEPFAWYEVEGSNNTSPGFDPYCMWMAHRLGAEDDAVRHGIPIMEIQRRECARLVRDAGQPADLEWCGIGGGVWTTEIKRHAVTQSKIHAWPDVVGELIKPVWPYGEPPLLAPSWIPEHRKQEWLDDYRAGRIGMDMSWKKKAVPQLFTAPPSLPLNRADRRRLEKLQQKSGRSGGR